MPPLTNRGSEYDWMRYFWDMHTDQDVDIHTLIKLDDNANPHDWDPDGSTSTANDDPAQFWLFSAAITGVYTEHLNELDNGVDH